MSELSDAWNKWAYFCESYLVMRDARYGNFLHLPFSGGVLEQPAKTMRVYQIIGSCYCDKLSEDMEKATSKFR